MAERSLQLTAYLAGENLHLTVWECTFEDGEQQPGEVLLRTTRKMPVDGTVEDWRRDVAVAFAELL